MKLPHFLLFYACLASVGAVAQDMAPGPSGERDPHSGFEREFPQDFGRERPDARDRINRDELRDPREQMSPEERRQLRRDVNDAGRELYGRRRRY